MYFQIREYKLKILQIKAGASSCHDDNYWHQLNKIR